jgi:hypothetical protein
VRPRHGRLGGEGRGLLAGAALAVECGARYGLGEPRPEHAVAADVSGLPDLLGAPDDDVLDQRGIDARTRDQGRQLPGQQIGRMHRREPTPSLPLTDRCSHRVDDDRLLHNNSNRSNF